MVVVVVGGVVFVVVWLLVLLLLLVWYVGVPVFVGRAVCVVLWRERWCR